MLYFRKEPFVVIKIYGRAQERSDSRRRRRTGPEWREVGSPLTRLWLPSLRFTFCSSASEFLIFKVEGAPGEASRGLVAAFIIYPQFPEELHSHHCQQSGGPCP